MRPSRDQTMLELCAVIARRSTCARRKVGAVATDGYGRVLAVAHNGVARGQRHCGQGLNERPCPGFYQQSGYGLDLCEAIHAEANLVGFCPDIMRIDTVYCTTAPCVHCAKMLLNTSARRVVFSEGYAHDERSRELWTADGTRTWEHRGQPAGPHVHAGI